MKRTTFIAAMLCLLGAGLSCTHDEPNNSDTGTSQRVVEWQDSTLSGDAVMGEKMIFKVGGGMSVERSEGTRATTDVNGIAKFTVNDLVTIGVTRGTTDETKNYKVTATSQTSADPEVWTSSLAYNGSASDAFFWKSTGESVTIRAWSYGDGSTTSSDPDNQTYTLSEDQSTSYGELLYSKAAPFDYETYSGGIPIQFCHQMTRLVISLTHIKPGDLDISEIYIGDGSETPIPTTAKFHKPTSGNVGTWDNLGSEKGQITPKTEAANSCYSAVLIPTTYEVADKKFVIIKTSDSRTYCYIPNQNLTLVAGTQYNYTISVKDLKEVSTLTIGDIAAYTYDGTAKTPTPIVKDGTKTLVKDIDYELSYSNNINAGTATVTVTGKGGYYSGSQSKNFTINRKALTADQFKYATTSKTETYIWDLVGYSNTLTNTEGATVEYTSSNPNVVSSVNSSTGVLTLGTTAGTTIITATATGNYSGTASYTVTATYNYKDFAYTNNVQSITLPKGTYKLEVWGAAGGISALASNASGGGAKGGYSCGNKSLTASTPLFVCVGGMGSGNYDTSGQSGHPWPTGKTGGAGGYNGGAAGGNGGYQSASVSWNGGSGGGGATHVATVTGVLSALASQTDKVLIVAGGGGGAHGPGTVATSTNQAIGGVGGAEDSGGYSFGQGQQGRLGTNTGPGMGEGIGGGGGGYAGGSYPKGGTCYVGGVDSGSTTAGVRSGNGAAKITWVSN